MTSESPSSPEPISRKDFFVDTKTTCFLCLKDIQSSPPVIDLENEDDNEDTTLDGLEGEKFYMKPIFRYLNINPDILFKGQLTTKLLNKISDWKVLLCRECIPFANRISELGIQLEMLQMKMNHSIQQFQDIIDKSEKDGEKLKKFKGLSTNPTDTLHASIADLLRNETREKCNAHFKKSSPKVNVKIFQETSAEIIPRQTTSLPPPPPSTLPLPQNVMTPAHLKCKICNAAFGARSGLRSHIQRRHTPDSAIPIEPPITKFKLQKNSRHKCHFCKTTYTIASSLRRHMNRHHTNDSTTSLKCNKCGLQLPSRPEWIKHTRLYCILRRTNTASSSQNGSTLTSAENPPPPLNPMQPPPPPISVGSSTPLTTVNLAKMIDSIPHLKTGRNGGLLCALCPLSSSMTTNEVFQREDLLRRHMFLNHLDYFFGPVKLPEVSSEQFKTFCKEIVENDMKPTQNSGLPGSGRFGSLTFACAHCSCTFYERRAMNAHLIRSHYSILAPKLVDLQRNQGVFMDTSPIPVEVPIPSATSSKTLTDKALNLQLVLSNAKKAPMVPLIEAHLERFRKKRRSNQGHSGEFCCAECGLTFAHRSSLTRHRSTTNHKIDAFESSQQSVSESSTGISCGNGTSKFFVPPQWTCQDCGNKFSSSSSMYRHQREYCSVAKSRLEEEQSGVAVVMEGDADGDMGYEQEYFYESNEEEMGIVEQGEEDEEEAYTESYVNTKIEVIEMDQVQILPKMEDGQVRDDVYQEYLTTSGGGGGEEEMILPGSFCNDPLF